MTDAISQYGRPNPSDNAVRGNGDKVSKKAGAAPSALSSSAEGSAKSSASSPGADSVSLSNVTQKAMAEPDFDRAKVEAIKTALREGSYPINPSRIAENFVALEKMI